MAGCDAAKPAGIIIPSPVQNNASVSASIAQFYVESLGADPISVGLLTIINATPIDIMHVAITV